MDSLAEAKRMYPGAKHLYRTSDNSIHTTLAGAEAQARHLANAKIETIKTIVAKAHAARPK